jgi:hypothetical protein
MVGAERMDEGAFQCFRNAMSLVNAAYMRRSGLEGITAYLAGPEPDAARYNMFLMLRGELENLRKPQDQQPPYSREELGLGAACNALFSRLARPNGSTFTLTFRSCSGWLYPSPSARSVIPASKSRIHASSASLRCSCMTAHTSAVGRRRKSIKRS